MRLIPAISGPGAGARRAALSVAMVVAAAGCGASGTAEAEREAAASAAKAVGAPVARVQIVEPAEGAELTGDVRVVLAAENIEIAPAGDTRPNTAHHHLFLNRETTPEGEAIPAGEPDIVHLGKAQTEHVFSGLPPGEYTLVAVLGDLVHRVIPQATDTVRFRVVAQ